MYILSSTYLNMNDLAADTSRVLKENYPDYIIKNNDGIVTAKKKIKAVKKIEIKKDSGSSWFDFLNIYNYF